MPGNYWTGFQFDSVRHDGNIEQGPRDEEGPDERLSAATYPFLTCEIGSGMISTTIAASASIRATSKPSRWSNSAPDPICSATTCTTAASIPTASSRR